MRSGGASRAQPARLEEQHPIGERARLGRIVAANDRGPARLADHVVAQERAQIARAARVQPQRRLVEQQHLRIAEQPARQREPLPHAARILAVAAVGGVGQPDALEQRRRAPPRLARGQPVQRREVVQVARAPTRGSGSCARRRPRTRPAAGTPTRRSRRRCPQTRACPTTAAAGRPGCAPASTCPRRSAPSRRRSRRARP